ncbi:MFS transporter [Luteipulveratus halotolerans]|uniref:MFS transporter n=1 Tax=Luteipulveratus halotolerans TaxID=1631356 RepID=A0A0L6CKP1_9MICO|nr:MFS transporter [Luteipulveratus halotolerans]KNX38366.1 MFS transporter [Luteipulveratus halotolerans]
MTSSRRPEALLATASIAVALAAADTYVVVLALEDMMSGVGLGIDALQKATPIISGFLLGYIAVLPLIGRLADLVARQRVLVACLALFVVGSAITALAVELPVLVTGRVLQGIGGGGLVPATLALVADLWPPGKRGTPLGVVGAVQEIGSVLGPLLGALILAVWDWRMIFWINVIAGVVLGLIIRVVGGRGERSTPHSTRHQWWVIASSLAALATVVLLGLALWAPDRLVTDITYGEPFVPYAGHTSRLYTQIGLWGAIALAITVVVSVPLWWPVLRKADLIGAALITVALGSLVLTFASANPEKQVVGPLGWWLLPVAAVAALLYLVRHRTAREPLIAQGVVQGRVLPALIVSLMVGTAIVAIVVDIPVLARLTGTEDQTDAALVLVRFLVAVPVGALAGGWLLRRYGPGLVAAPGLALAAVGLGLMSRWGQGSLDDVLSTIVLVVVGFGIGLAIAPVNDAALADAPQTHHGVASALVVVARMIGMVVGLGLLTAIGLHRFYAKIQALPNPTGDQVREAGVVQVQTVFVGAAIAALVATGVALLLGRERVAHHDLTDEDVLDERQPNS